MRRSVNNKFVYLSIFLSLIFIISFYLIRYFDDRHHKIDQETNSIYEHIDYQSLELSLTVDNISKIIAKNPNNYWNELDETLIKTNNACFIVIYDSLSYWNTNKLGILKFDNLITDNNIHVAKLSTGWYLYLSKKQNNRIIYLFKPIKYEYQVDNELLTKSYSPEYSHNHGINLTLDSIGASQIIYNSQGQFLLGIKYNNENSQTNSHNNILFILFLFSYAFLILSILQILYNSKLYEKSYDLSFAFFILIVILFRFCDNYLVFPANLKETSLFTVNIFDIPFSHTMGDLLINILCFVLISFAINLFYDKTQKNTSSVKIISSNTFLWIIILIGVYFISQTIFDQNFNLLTENILKDNRIIILSFIIAAINMSLYYIFITYLNSYHDRKVPFYIPFLISSIGISAIYFITDIDVYLLATTLILTFTIIFLKQFFWRFSTNKFLNHLIILVLLSIISSFLISNSSKVKNDKYQEFIAHTMAITNDALFEYTYETIIDDILKDNKLKKIVFNDSIPSEEALEEYIRFEYFKGYLHKYDIQITVCNEGELLEIQPEGEVYDCAEYFNSIITDYTIPIIDSFLFQFNSGTESIYYISKMTINHAQNPNIKRNIFIEFIASHVPEGLGYPELLIDTRSNKLNLSQYSFAVYSNNYLTYKFGDFAYNTYLSFVEESQLNNIFDYDNYRHYYIQISEFNYLIISREKTTITMQVVSFSIVFILLSFISLIIYILFYLRKAINLFRFNFKTRLQTFVIASLTITFMLMAVAILVYIQDSSRDQIEKQLSEKSNSVLIELQHKLNSVKDFNSQDEEFLHQLLRKFSLVFFSDINLYDKSGHLIATSRPEIFEKGLLSPYINPMAYKAIFFDNKLNYITEENIGELKYYSAYVPINLNNDYPIGIVNLPYFARQNEFTKSYYIMLSYLINIYVIIGIIGLLIAIIFSRYLTRPLVLLQENLASIRIDKHNEKIQWNKNDEIGLLIHEYNRMVDKLEHSADLLKHSERESAWREVARQIAHEIKNPLTPMKLNVQFLLKSYKNNDPEFESKINSISKSLITQIDTLDNVAEMFSNFAKSKSLDFSEVDLSKVLLSSVNLFNKNSKVSISIKFENDDSKFITIGFEKDILRAINNILKNAIQSSEKTNDGIIKIVVNKDSKFITVAITDNGNGISEQMKQKIFQPYFTTKTSGTGLGLAIVKNIMNEIGGEVYFESENQKETTFFLRFPEASS